MDEKQKIQTTFKSFYNEFTISRMNTDACSLGLFRAYYKFGTKKDNKQQFLGPKKFTCLQHKPKICFCFYMYDCRKNLTLICK